jgi:hypothetical protein
VEKHAFVPDRKILMRWNLVLNRCSRQFGELYFKRPWKSGKFACNFLSETDSSYSGGIIYHLQFGSDVQFQYKFVFRAQKIYRRQQKFLLT